MALIPPFFMDCVVAIGIESNVNGKTEKHWIGTGFLFGKFIEVDKNNPDMKHYGTWLVTNKHVLEDQESIILRFNPKTDQAAKDFKSDLFENKKQIWTGHPDKNVDVAVVKIVTKHLKDNRMKYSYFRSDDTVLDKKGMEKNEISEGDHIYALGFPMGLINPLRQHVIVRSGIIARIRDLYENRSKDFIVDAMVFPGNSGGPVILQPQSMSITGTNAHTRAELIGIVKSYIPFREIAVSQQTLEPRIIFEENSGLTLVEPVDHILETIELAEKSVKKV
ncbi:serine protease [Fulvivirgaceae bacterium BMA10]|uniref:Serine protease n=1 Tax=Splendidivirga corallicola TaxID=3051826 RepID=A0ABT8KGV2_9BACT|nr:serine protease [Fulvivirgaceae bacterium BMA10]